MHSHHPSNWQHDHDFTVIHEHGEQRTLKVLALTAVTMAVEIAAGLFYGSMALLADGWHMGTHVAAFLITIAAYRFARRHAGDPSFAFGTGKVSVLGGFASAVALAVVALMMAVESLQRIIAPQPIHFKQALLVALLGLAVNIASAFLLEGGHGHRHNDEEPRHPQDHNLKAAYLHVLADAFTSLLAIISLAAGWFSGWSFLDPAMGIVGALVIVRWAWTLLRETAPILLDGSIEGETLTAIRQKIEGEGDNRVADLHVWRVGPAHYAAIISIVSRFPRGVDHYKNLLKDCRELVHVTIETNACGGEPCILPEQEHPAG